MLRSVYTEYKRSTSGRQAWLLGRAGQEALFRGDHQQRVQERHRGREIHCSHHRAMVSMLSLQNGHRVCEGATGWAMPAAITPRTHYSDPTQIKPASAPSHTCMNCTLALCFPAPGLTAAFPIPVPQAPGLWLVIHSKVIMGDKK